jgi:UDP-N-acetylglucosamine--N-acetylmuramyl-(pentapeptide) pyrophosphoryl-undecaprenol N-acetylglucosamine transferase
VTRVVLAGGGTAGHTSPLIATAEALKELEPGVDLLCVGTPRGLETRVIPAAGLELALVDPVPLPRKLNTDLMTLPVRLAKAVGQAKRLLRRHQAQVVAGFGGYASLPVFLAARQLKIPVIAHEANAVPGLTNRIAARFARHIVVMFPITGLTHQRVIGLPLRRAIATLDRPARRGPARAEFGLPPYGPVLLVSGGSQGARSINTAVKAGIGDLLAAGISVLHVTGPKNFEEAAPAADDPDTGARYRPVAYVDAMGDAYAAADLMLGRAGAATVAELGALGLPGLLVPLPHGNGEQAKNAADLAAAGGAVLIADAELTPARLVAEASAILTDPDRLAAMAAAGPPLSPRDAAETLAQLILETAGTAHAA